MQANQYEIQQPNLNLSAFFDNTMSSFNHPAVTLVAKEIERMRNERKSVAENLQ